MVEFAAHGTIGLAGRGNGQRPGAGSIIVELQGIRSDAVERNPCTDEEIQFLLDTAE
ncbi:hypothetical protein [Nannocystis sp. SCPEA4]|uniref:hypothetical protein n=1 Tax=Nannocystis sp. SCPEA4 TaxID=2996787 RepID=UPI0022717C4D|nr:hypothetical protein [Nannocystis sp. SCPEA4]MCY1060357.1 hypothetical protein [Nannocystis sp. SCPEA4]